MHSNKNVYSREFVVHWWPRPFIPFYMLVFVQCQFSAIHMTVHYYQMNGNLFRTLAHEQSAQPTPGVADSTKFKLINKLLETLFASAGGEDYKNINMSTGMGGKDNATFRERFGAVVN